MNAPQDDLDRIMAVMAAAFDPAFGEAWTRRQVEDALILGNCHYGLVGPDGLVPSTGEAAAGFYLARQGFDEVELLLLGVVPGHRRSGLGSQLLNGLAARARLDGASRLLLEMRRGNPAEALYRRHGFEVIGERPNYYRGANGERISAITFAKYL